MVKERFERPPWNTAPGDQTFGEPDTGPGMEVIETEDSCQMAVEGGFAAPCRRSIKNDDVFRRGPEPDDETCNIPNSGDIPEHAACFKEPEPECQTVGIGAHRVRGPLQPAKWQR
jgi:hypothetical protein